MTLAGLTQALASHLAVVNLRLALLEGSEPQAAAAAAIDLVRRLLLESGLGETESDIVLRDAQDLVNLVTSQLPDPNDTDPDDA